VGNGQSIIDLGTDPNAQIIQTFEGQNVFADVTTVSVPAPLIGFGFPVFLAVGGLWFGARLLERFGCGAGLLRLHNLVPSTKAAVHYWLADTGHCSQITDVGACPGPVGKGS